jgi:hypothetical protein
VSVDSAKLSTMNRIHLNDRTRMIVCAVLLGACFGIGYPALFNHQMVVWGICALASLPLSRAVGHYHRAARRRQ